MKIAVVVDSGSNYYNENIHLEGLYAVPLQIIDGDKGYRESVDISISQVNELIREGKQLKTSLPILGELTELFESIKSQGYDRIFAVPITSGISGTINAMINAAEMAEIPFDYIDCFSTQHIALDCALEALKRFDQGEDVDHVKQVLLKHIERSDTIVIPSDLNHLARGGRLSPLAARLGGLLRIKPLLHLNALTQGVIEPLDKVRTMSKAIERTISILKDAGVNDHFKITLAHVDARDLCQQTFDKLKDAFPNADIVVRDLISTVSVHCGLGSIALQYMEKF